MTNRKRARSAALKRVGWGVLAAIALMLVMGGIFGLRWELVAALLVACGGYAVFVMAFFRVPSPKTPGDSKLVVSPAYGRVDVIERLASPGFPEGECQRISIFLSIFDVHVQHAPLTGKLVHFEYSPGAFRNAMRAESARTNENLLLGFSGSEVGGLRVGVRLIAGWIARRIVPWVEQGDFLRKGQLMSLIQFGSRCDVYLPDFLEIEVCEGQAVRGGETVLARVPQTEWSKRSYETQRSEAEVD